MGNGLCQILVEECHSILAIACSTGWIYLSHEDMQSWCLHSHLIGIASVWTSAALAIVVLQQYKRVMHKQHFGRSLTCRDFAVMGDIKNRLFVAECVCCFVVWVPHLASPAAWMSGLSTMTWSLTKWGGSDCNNGLVSVILLYTNFTFYQALLSCIGILQ